jgi:hypothetical protein
MFTHPTHFDPKTGGSKNLRNIGCTFHFHVVSKQKEVRGICIIKRVITLLFAKYN